MFLAVYGKWPVWCITNIKVFVAFRSKINDCSCSCVQRSAIRCNDSRTLHRFFGDKVDSILNGILRCTAYNFAFSSNIFFEICLCRLCAIYLLKLQSFVTFEMTFKNALKSTRLLHVTRRWNIAKYVARYEKRIRRFYVPKVFNALPEEVCIVSGKAK